MGSDGVDRSGHGPRRSWRDRFGLYPAFAGRIRFAAKPQSSNEFGWCCAPLCSLIASGGDLKGPRCIPGQCHRRARFPHQSARAQPFRKGSGDGRLLCHRRSSLSPFRKTDALACDAPVVARSVGGRHKPFVRSRRRAKCHLPYPPQTARPQTNDARADARAGEGNKLRLCE